MLAVCLSVYSLNYSSVTLRSPFAALFKLPNKFTRFISDSFDGVGKTACSKTSDRIRRVEELVEEVVTPFKPMLQAEKEAIG